MYWLAYIAVQKHTKRAFEIPKSEFGSQQLQYVIIPMTILLRD